MTGYFRRHWRGEYSLPVSYWLNGNLPAVLLIALAPLQDWLANGSVPLRIGAAICVAMLVATALLWGWALTGIWRSARGYRARGGSRVWTWLARGSVALSAVSLGYLAVTSMVPVGREFAYIALGNDPLGEVRVEASPDGRDILLTGMLREGVTARVRAVLAATPNARMLRLDSRGGRLVEGEMLARLVRERGLDTHVDARCSSACTFVFLAGQERTASPEARIGFHLPAVPGTYAPAQHLASERMIATYRAAGLPEAFIARVAATPNRSAWYPTREELIDAHVITRAGLLGASTPVSPGAASRDPSTDPAAVPAAVQAADPSTAAPKTALADALAADALVQAYESRFPGSLPALTDKSWATMAGGGTDADVMAAARAFIRVSLPPLLGAADGALLDRYMNMHLAQLSAARGMGGAACDALIDGSIRTAAMLPPALVEEERATMIALLTPAPPRNTQARANRHEADAMIATAVRLLPVEHARILHNPELYARQPGKVCEATLSFYRLVRSLPDAQRQRTERALFARSASGMAFE